MANYYPRDIVPLIGRALRSMPVVVVTGMRQTGKSTMLKMDPSLRERDYVSFDDFAQLLSPSRLGRDARLKAATATRYLSILEASFVIRRVFPYLRNRSSRLIKSPKMYVSDSGLACHLAGIRNFDIEGGVPFKGALFETYIAQNLAGLIDSFWPDAELGFWHIQGRHEVDFVIEDGGKCIALEIKSGTRWGERELSGLKTFLGKTPQCTAAILAYNGDSAVRLGKRLWAIPLGMILS